MQISGFELQRLCLALPIRPAHLVSLATAAVRAIAATDMGASRWHAQPESTVQIVRRVTAGTNARIFETSRCTACGDSHTVFDWVQNAPATLPPH